MDWPALSRSECKHEKAVVILETGGVKIARCPCGAVLRLYDTVAPDVIAEPLPRDAQGDFPSIRIARLEREAKTDAIYERQVAAMERDIQARWEHESERWREMRDEERRKIAVWQSLADGLLLVACAGLALAAIALSAIIVMVNR